MIQFDSSGWAQDVKIAVEKRPKIEHGPLGTINAIVIHRTSASTAQSTLSAWKTKSEGAHFLISEGGSIFQCASYKKQCWHVGQLYARCELRQSCSLQDAQALQAMLHAKNASWGTRFRMIARHEIATKQYPDRYPSNGDSLGIEVVGAMSSRQVYEMPNKVQLDALFWLLDQLIAATGIGIQDIYAHGRIAHKDNQKTEGTNALIAYRVARGASATTAP